MKQQRLLIEWYKDGSWFGTNDNRRTAAFRERAEIALSRTKERYIYLTPRLRISYDEN